MEVPEFKTSFEKGVKKKANEYYFIIYPNEKFIRCGLISMMRVTSVFNHG